MNRLSVCRRLIIYYLLSIAFILSASVSGFGQELEGRLSLLKCKDGVYHYPDTTIGGDKYFRRAVIIDYSINEIWPVVSDQSKLSDFMPKIKKYQAVEADSGEMIYLCEVKPKWYLKTYACTVSVEIVPFREISWRRIGGDFNHMIFVWRFEQLDSSKTLATYSAAFDLGGIIPGFLVNWGIKKKLPEMMIYYKEWVEKEVSNTRAGLAAQPHSSADDI